MKTLKVDEQFINDLYNNKNGKLPQQDFEELVYEPAINEYLCLQSGSKQSAIVRYLGYDNISIVSPKLALDFAGLKPKDNSQLALVDSLKSPIPLVVCFGPAGSGKTLLSIAYGIQEITSSKDSKLILVKATETVKQSKFFGAVPGGVQEKYAPFLDSFLIAAKRIIPDKDYLNLLFNHERIIFKPIEFTRGDTYDNSIIIVDEAQNISYHEIKTLITRVGQNSKIIILADITQKDVRQDELSGPERIIDTVAFEESDLTSYIELKNNYRSPISNLMVKIDKEIGF